MAKKFLFVCMGFLCLAVAYHLGAQSAAAQAGAIIDGPELAPFGGGFAATGAVGRTFYANGGTPVGQPIPGSAAVVETAQFSNSGNPYGVLLANGDVYVYYTSTGWTLIGNMLGSTPTSATHEMWGSVKARYR